MKNIFIHLEWICLLILTPVVFSACKKTKVDNPYPLTGFQVGGAAPSSVRLFNFYNGTLDVRANNVPLTAFTSASIQGNQIGLSLFPSGSWSSGDDGSPVTMPVSLFDKNGQLHVIIQARGIQGYQGLGTLPLLNIDTILDNDPVHPKDYYVMGNGTLKTIDRNIVAPSQSDHFKLRIMNFGQRKDTLGLIGAVVLTLADGTVVQSLNWVDSNAISPYVEIPYGSYQFRLYVAKAPGVPDYTKQLAELPVYPDFSSRGNTPQVDLTTRVRGFKPGGTYTMLITPNVLGYNTNTTGGETPLFYLMNSYRVLTEQSAPQNISWARIQAVNAWQDQPVSFRLDGGTLTSGLGLGQSGDYSSVVQGSHHVDAVDGSGNIIASGDMMLYPYDNITAWVFSQNGKAAIVFTNTDLTTTLDETPTSNVVDDGTDGSLYTLQYKYAMQFRFMNFSDVPYVTFTKNGALLNPDLGGVATNPGQNDTVAYPQAFINLQPGLPVKVNPFVVYPSNEGNWTITLNGQTYIEGAGSNKIGLALSHPLPLRAFSSAPADGEYAARVPGAVLGNVVPLQDKDLASGTLIYANGVPQRAENGFYTVALIGNVLGGSGPAGRLIVVKHNK